MQRRGSAHVSYQGHAGFRQRGLLDLGFLSLTQPRVQSGRESRTSSELKSEGSNQGGATPDPCEMVPKMRTAPLPERRRRYRKNRCLRGHATPDFCDWSRGQSHDWPLRYRPGTAAIGVFVLVPLHRGFDQLLDRWLEAWQRLWVDEDSYAACDAWLTVDQSGAFEGEHHLVDRRWGDAEEALQVGFGGRAAKDQGIGVDEGEILALLGREAQ
jgi:hypothetical protein